MHIYIYIYIYIFRTNDSSPGQCGLAMNPIIALGGYVLNKNDLDLTDGTASIGDGGGKDNVHGLPFGASFFEWIWRHWKAICISAATCLMLFSLFLLALATYMDYIQNITNRSGEYLVINPLSTVGSYNEVPLNERPLNDNCSREEGLGATPRSVDAIYLPHSYKYHSMQLQQARN
jgi:hypothetical protein